MQKPGLPTLGKTGELAHLVPPSSVGAGQAGEMSTLP